MKYARLSTAASYTIRLEKGESVFAAILDFCNKEQIQHAHLSAIGAVKEARVGWYDLESKTYGAITYPALMEVSAFTANISIVENKPFMHAHVVLSDTTNAPIAGHLFEATVGVTLEVSLQAYTQPVSRELDEEVGLKLLRFDGCNL